MTADEMRKSLTAVLRATTIAVAAFLAAPAGAQTSIDNTCATCGRRSLDSLNLKVNPVRVNQVGYRTADLQKSAFVGAPKSTRFQVVRENGTVAFSGSLQDVGSFPYKGRIQIRGYFNSITPLYTMTNTTNLDSADASAVEHLWRAEFGTLQEEGTFRVVVGSDSSLPFEIRKNIYNDVFETSLKFFGWQRSGDNDAWSHGPSHMKDGSGRPGGAAKAGSLQGGWYDCGDYFKVGQTIGYSFTNLILAYTLWPQKAEDRYGSSYNDTLPFGNDGIPDLLREAKIGADYVMRLYRASEEDGLLAQNRMYQDVGVWMNDHLYWDRPENADAAPVAKGGPARPVVGDKGAAVPAQFAGSLALFAQAWEPFDPAFADSCLKAARDIYSRVVLPNRLVPGAGTVDGFYITQTRWDDDLAWAASNLWYATRDTLYRFHLMRNPAFGNNPGHIFNMETFPAGFMAMHASKLFSPGGWVMDYQNTHLHTSWLLYKKIFRTDSLAARWGVTPAEAQDARRRLVNLVGTRYASESTNGDGVYPGTEANILKPYNLVWSSITWGMNRYNMGGLLPIVAYHDMIRDDSAAAAQPYLDLILDNMDYNLGRNPWDISFLMGAGSKNLQHPHNRIANPEGYNAGGIPYKYRSPKGALMGGAIPGQLLRDEWEKYDVTETCIDFSAQMVLPSQYLAEDLPPDNEGPVFSDVTVVFVSDTSASIVWRTNELSRDTLYFSLTPGGPLVGKIPAKLAKSKAAELGGLTPNTTYYFWFTGMDIYRNVSRDDNRGRYYQFTTTTTSVPPAKITDVKVCNIRHDRATIFWWTDVPAPSTVEYAVEGADFAATKIRVDGDDEGIPGRFHKVTLRGLKAGTIYRFDAISGAARSDSAGLHHRFRTIKDFANYTVQIKSTTKNGVGNGHFYLEVANNDPKPYVGLELRLYFQADATTASKIVVHTSDDAIFDVTGTMRTSGPSLVTIGSAVAVPGIANQWYLPIVIKDTLPVAGRARVELKIDDSNWGPIPLSVFQGAWSLTSHTSPVAFGGVDLYQWKGPDHVEMRNGEPVVTYVETPYIAAFFEGEHIYGYPPDGTKPKVVRTTDFRFATPAPSPATSSRQDSLRALLSGRTWSYPDVVAAQWQVDGPVLRSSRPLAGQTDSVLFSHDTTESQGTNSHEFAFWGDRDSAYCSCAWSRYLVAVDTQKAIPPTYRLEWRPDTAASGLVGTRIPLLLVLSSDTADTIDASGTLTLTADKPSLQFFASATGGAPLASTALKGGIAFLWVSSGVPVDSATITAAATVPGAIVVPGTLFPVSFAPRPPWPLVDSARIEDADCDGRGDSARLFLDAPLAVEHRVAGATVRWRSGSAEVAAASIATTGAVVSVALPAGFPDTTAPQAEVVLRIRVLAGGDTTVALAATALDRIGPRLLGASILENFATGTTPDTVRALFSEPVVLAPAAWPFTVTRGGRPVAPGLRVVSVREVGPALYEFALQGNAAGGTLLRATDVLRLDPAVATRDSAGNLSDGCGDSAALALRVKPVPMIGGWVADSDGDGRADRVVVRFARALRDVDLPDTLRLAWANGEVATVSREDLASGVADLALPVVPPWTATQGAGVQGAGEALFLQGQGAAGRRETISLADSVGPVLRTAIVRYGRAGFPDTLILRLSEPVMLGAAAPELERLQGADVTARGRSMGATAETWRLVVDSTDPGYPEVGDSVRLPVPGPWEDARGNAPGARNPWVVVRGGDRPPEKAWAEDSDADGRVDRLFLRMAREPSIGTTFDMAWPDSAGAGLDLRHIGRWTWDAGSRTAILVPEEPFDLGATSTDPLRWPWLGAMNVDLDGVQDTLPFAVEDSADPVVLDAVVRYGTEDGDRDTLVARFSETVIFVALPPVVLHRRGAVPEEPVTQLDVLQSPDGRSALIFLGPGTTSFRRNDSVRIAPFSTGSVRDLHGNAAEEPGFWVPVRFGTRKARFRIAMHPASLIERPPTAPDGSPAVEVLVRPRGETRWTHLDGTAADGIWRIGPRIETNVPLAGSIHIYDRMGVFVASIDLSELARAVYGERVPVDPAGRYEFWVAWNGRSEGGRAAASGVYYARLLLQEAPEGEPGPGWINRVVNFGITTR